MNPLNLKPYCETDINLNGFPVKIHDILSECTPNTVVANIESSYRGLNTLECVVTYDVDDIMRKLKQQPETDHQQACCIPTYIKQDKNATIVYWQDGTYTPVVFHQGDGEPNVYSAFCAALAKKLFGGTTAVHKTVDRVLDTTINAQKEAEAKRRKAEADEQRKIRHDRKVRARAKELKLLTEARQLIEKEAEMNAEKA